MLNWLGLWAKAPSHKHSAKKQKTEGSHPKEHSIFRDPLLHCHDKATQYGVMSETGNWAKMRSPPLSHGTFASQCSYDLLWRMGKAHNKACPDFDGQGIGDHFYEVVRQRAVIIKASNVVLRPICLEFLIQISHLEGTRLSNHVSLSHPFYRKVVLSLILII